MAIDSSLLLVAKVSVVLAAACAAAWWLRRDSASSAHRMWSLAFAAILALPFAGAFVPALRIPVPEWRSEIVAGAELPAPVLAPIRFQRAIEVAPEGLAPERSVEVAPESVWTMPSMGTIVRAAWAAGAAIAIGAMLLALARVRSLRRRSEPFDDPAWRDAAEAIGGSLGCARCVALLVSDAVPTPMAGGVLRPAIFLPASARTWTPEVRDIVLTHEIAHLASRDPLRQLVARVAFALYWFHPLVWLASRQAAAAREQACDEAVIAMGTRRSTYARVLLEFAGGPAAPRACAALPMVKPSLLEKRLMAILDDSARPSRRRFAIHAAAAAVITVSIAAAQPAAKEHAVAQEQTLVLSGNVTVRDAAQGITLTADKMTVIGDKAVLEAGPTTITASQSGGSVRMETACDASFTGPFNGSIWSNDRGRPRVYDQVGWRGDMMVFMRTFGDLRVCALAEGIAGDRDRDMRGFTNAPRWVIETREGNQNRKMQSNGGVQTWWVNGQQRPMDGAAADWRDRVVAVVEAAWELSMLHGEASTLHGEISTIYGERSTLHGEISTLRGHVSTLQGQISTIRGEESTLRGEISTIRGHVSTLQGQISTIRGAISSIEASRWGATDEERKAIDARINRHRADIAAIQNEIQRYNADAKVQEVEQQIRRLDTDRRVREIEDEIRRFNVDAKTAEVEKRIGELEVDTKVKRIERMIAELEVDRRSRDLEARIEDAVRRLRAAIR